MFAPRSIQPSPGADILITTIFISNLHCPSCIESIEESLSAISPAPASVSCSVASHSVTLRHNTTLAVDQITGSVEAAGFEVHSVFQENANSASAPVEVSRLGDDTVDWSDSFEHAIAKWFPTNLNSRLTRTPTGMMREKHVEQCGQCKAEAGGVKLTDDTQTEKELKPMKPEPRVTYHSSIDDTVLDGAVSPIMKDFVSIGSTDGVAVCKAVIAIEGMTCSSCVNSVTQAVEQLPWVRSVNVNLLTNSATVVFEGGGKIDEIISSIEDTGFGASVEKFEHPDKWRATYSITGMTCSVCVGNISEAVKKQDWVEKVEVNLLSNSGTIVFLGRDHLDQLKEIIEDAGYDANLDSIVPEGVASKQTTERHVAIRIDGMFCHHCPENILRELVATYGKGQHSFAIEEPLLSQKQPIVKVKYMPDPPNLTLRDIFHTIEKLNPNFKLSVHHPPTIEERAREMHRQERRRILFRLVLSVIIAIPTFILGIVFMSLVKESHPIRRYVMQPMWAGNATRLSWALFILATPLYFLAADTFHRRAFKELKALWRPGSRFSYLHRFTRFGSMNMLMSLGTSIAYFASIVELALAAAKKSSGSMTDSYFDAVVFLTMFLLIGRFLEAYSKAKTGDAVTSLGNLRPKEAILVTEGEGDVKIPTDLLEIGDTVRVYNGTSPPFDGVVLEGRTDFDESSLTGESRPVKKEPGEAVYSGTVNKGSPIKIKINTIAGSSMLDQIIDAVREGQTRRAPVERVASTITGHFVPCVVLIAILTWVIWLALGTSGTIPDSWRNEGSGGWALWSLRFAIAVFVIACPCGIGLAAPTALFVGGGLAAQHGILVKGGGEAFQEASSLDCIVFDKTGTLTQGGDPAVTDHKLAVSQDRDTVFGIVKALEEQSNHPIARALITFCNAGSAAVLEATEVDEIPGKGLKGTFVANGQQITAIIGNEALMTDHHVDIAAKETLALEDWKKQGKSVALAALSVQNTAQQETVPTNHVWELAGMFSISDPLRPEAASVIAQLQKRGIDVWMLSGDNPITANAVGQQVGIPASNIIAGVLPEQKAQKIKYLQQTLTKKPNSTTSLFRIPSFLHLSRGNPKQTTTPKRATIAMVGDGINDAPALSTADLSIAIGSGSDIALSSSSFILITSRLTSLLTLLDLSRVVFRRVYFNFAWALVYNVCAMPIAAGVLYPITTGGGHPKNMDMHHNGVGMEGGMGMGDSGVRHVRLDPVWASLAMALSSVSVVCSSLLLRSRVPWVGFKGARKE
ncbi:heavy metal translocatin [Periconia macrospinosa]|uniref:Heavy metal translocatin n=1 Tax=Periconia macrospinosa TaxID=97972 RepID=A0A2V1DMT1_9PLEO|nr:heavy metal translocatin [Periconia macrospinosa]